MTATCKLIKLAWIREPGHPVGSPALGRLNCKCGHAPLSHYKPTNGPVKCACGACYTWDGYVIDMAALPVRRVQIINKEHPEWGTWGVMDDHGDYYDIQGDRGGRVLFKDEAFKFWDVHAF